MTPTESGNSIPYELCLMRHGIAAEFAPDGSFDDAKRHLTLEGREKIQEVAKGLKRLKVEFDWIVTSPLVRAAETAEIVREAMGGTAPLETCEALSPGEPADKILAFLAKQKERRRILLVGHEPDMSMLAARLIGAGANANLGFKKGGCCLIVVGQLTRRSPGLLMWWLTPKILRSLK